MELHRAGVRDCALTVGKMHDKSNSCKVRGVRASITNGRTSFLDELDRLSPDLVFVIADFSTDILALLCILYSSSESAYIHLVAMVDGK